VGDHKPGFGEMKAYNMLNERMDKLSKLPPIMGKRKPPKSDPTPSGGAGSGGGSSS
jgi:hypothetical protein